jgi:hypothetical protein
LSRNAGSVADQLDALEYLFQTSWFEIDDLGLPRQSASSGCDFGLCHGANITKSLRND